jgi:hypothetical protein
MLPAANANAIETLATQLADLLSAQAADLREYALAVSVGEGTVQLERSLRTLEDRRASLYRRFEETVFVGPSIAIVPPNDLD